MNNLNQQVESVARAFYYAEGEGQSWGHEPEILKEEFRQYARDAVTLLEQQRELQLREGLTALSAKLVDLRAAA